MAQAVNNIVIIGGTGQVGGSILSALLDAKHFTITCITRPDSKSKLPDGVKVAKGEYDDKKFLEDTLKGQDALIVALGLSAPPKVQEDLIEVAAKVELPWIMTNYWSSDGHNEELVEAMPTLEEKNKFHSKIEELGKSSWIAVANNQWIDFGLRESYFGLDISSKKAVFYDQGTTKITTTTVRRVGLAVASIFSQPLSYLQSHKNNFVYINSFFVSQRDMLDSIQRATNTKDADWDISYKSTDQHMKEGWQAKDKEDSEGKMKLVYGPTFQEGLGDKFYGKETENEELGLEKEDLDEVVKKIVKEIEEKEKKEKEEKEKEKK